MILVYFPPWIQGGKEILQFSVAGGIENVDRHGRNFLGGNQIFLDQAGGTQNSDTKIILKMILIQK